MKVAIVSRRGYSHINEEPPELGSNGYAEWEENDLIIFSWIVDNIENDIIADFAHHQTSKALWDNLAITFDSKADKYLAYDLEDKIISIRQGDLDLETYYRRIHGLWVNIDRSQKQPVTCCDKGIKQYRQHSSEKRLFKFLTGLNAEHDSVRRDILKEEPYPSVEAAYAMVKKEAARSKIVPLRLVHPPQTSTAVPIHHRGKSGTILEHRAVGQSIGTHHNDRQPEPHTDQEEKQTRASFGAVTVGCRNTLGSSASNELDTQSGGMRSKKLGLRRETQLE